MRICFTSLKSLGARAHPGALCLWPLVYGCMMLVSANLQAQTVYRSVGPDGRVTFSDQPPATPSSKLTSTDNTVAAGQASGAALPYELRQVAAKYPVTLYASSNCAPCDSGRKLLLGRGVPFSEKTVTTAQDAEAFQSLSGNTSLPFLTIGAQHVAGYSSSEWTQYLNAAGYPERSKLPNNYRAPAATPLTAPAQPIASPPVPPAQAARPPAAPVTPRPDPSNPAGIQF